MRCPCEVAGQCAVLSLKCFLVLTIALFLSPCLSSSSPARCPMKGLNLVYRPKPDRTAFLSLKLHEHPRGRGLFWHGQTVRARTAGPVAG